MSFREQIPIDKGIDNTFSLLKEGYNYISNRTQQYNRNMFETRLLGGRKFICLIGKEAAETFYDTAKFKRQGAAPKRVLKTLFGEDGVQTLDDETHLNRKELFMSLMSKERIEQIDRIAAAQWQLAVNEWNNRDYIVLYDEVKKVMTRTACIWAGVPFVKKDEKTLTKSLSAMFEAGGAIGLEHFKGRLDRHNTEQWAEELIEAVRSGSVQPAQETALYRIAWHHDLNNSLLEPHIAAVELLNILRPITAISVYIAFCALALHEHPDEKDKLMNGDKKMYLHFVQEVRRYYPFFPMAIALVRKDFFWNGHDFKKDTPVLLDLYGTNHHPDLWNHPDQFNPSRFKTWDKSPFDFIPQGGGDYYQNHRCPGEWITVQVMTAVLEQLVHHMHYDVPKQNLTYSMSRMPSIPKSGFVMENIHGIEL